MRRAPQWQQDRYRPARRDLRVSEARAMLRGHRDPASLTAHAIECQFNLKPETAAALIAEVLGQ